jgi:hypothetical protein
VEGDVFGLITSSTKDAILVETSACTQRKVGVFTCDPRVLLDGGAARGRNDEVASRISKALRLLRGRLSSAAVCPAVKLGATGG